ncbi:DNA mismatch repair protein MutS [Synechococcus elongatus]|uniref:DNA mismatch repair protein MutS n=1 Tax=Synechococcus elongatus TaxID=32046 RepID=UPI000F7F8BCE|nr:DNA mismatch repair protein MutS [Synechococcus elongatus]
MTTSDLPEHLAKHEVRYADHRQVERDRLTPMMQHYAEVKDQHLQQILLYRMGDFFECFFQDAIVVARELELVLTSKEAGKEVGRVPMAGIPYHALDRYASQLVEKGYAIAICDQVEAAAQAQGPLVRREITRIITPGTILEEGMLQARRNNFLAAVVIAGEHWGLAYADSSTGDYWTSQSTGLEGLTQELYRLQPSEVLFPSAAPDLAGLLRPGQSKPQQIPDCLPDSFCYALRSPMPFELHEARQRLLEHFQLRSLEGCGCEQLPLAIRAAGGLLDYLAETQRESLAPLQKPRTYSLTEFLILDQQTRRNLEITQTQRDGSFHGSLLWALDRTMTSMGGRLLRRWLLQPLLNPEAIRNRQAAIQELCQDGRLRQDLRSLLQKIYDLERLSGRAGAGTANARDLLALAESLLRLPELAQLLSRAQSPLLAQLQQVPPELEQLGDRLQQHLVESPPLQLTEGGLIRSGVAIALDELRQQVESDRQWIASLEASERTATGINSLKVGYSKTFGYFISLSRSKADQVPDHYIRRQTLTNEERFITPDLKERESRILNAQTDLNQLEYDLFIGLRSEVSHHVETIRAIATAVAAADVLAALAEVAVYQNYCCPEIRDDRQLAIQDGRHPVVEQALPSGFYVPNSCGLGSDRGPDLIVLTGPNASGKSCYLRQVGLIQLLAQIGSFVPAKNAQVGICDRIFTRVGAVDDLATGQSTFMVEMNETANILNHATARSLVLLDEIGRGTATFDGLSIAWAVAEYLAREIQARTIFATHYHELNELSGLLKNVANFQVTVKELPDRIVFLHQVQPGGADRSYGIEAARLAGLPSEVIDRAREVMSRIEKHSRIAVGLRRGNGSQRRTQASPQQIDATITTEQLGLFSGPSH